MTLHLRLLLALIIVFILSIIPLPEFMVNFRPPWLLLLVLYVQFFLPSYFNVTLLFFFGICLDVLLVTGMGEHAFALLLSTWAAAGKARRFQFFSMIQQTLLVGLFCFIYQLTVFLIEAFLGYSNKTEMLLGAVLCSMFLWPAGQMLGKKVLLIKGFFREET